MGAAKFTDTGKALKEWCLEMHQKWVIDKQIDHKQVEFNDNTKMVV